MCDLREQRGHHGLLARDGTVQRRPSPPVPRVLVRPLFASAGLRGLGLGGVRDTYRSLTVWPAAFRNTNFIERVEFWGLGLGYMVGNNRFEFSPLPFPKCWFGVQGSGYPESPCILNPEPSPES